MPSFDQPNTMYLCHDCSMPGVESEYIWRRVRLVSKPRADLAWTPNRKRTLSSNLSFNDLLGVCGKSLFVLASWFVFPDFVASMNAARDDLLVLFESGTIALAWSLRRHCRCFLGGAILFRIIIYLPIHQNSSAVTMAQQYSPHLYQCLSIRSSFPE